ncbi:MAG: hypothetical protein KAX18_01415 [Candidatus Lokiarchaeota archaeon]|nr:hypothetical protein [Candidatus Lokiarchaeota archaeon]MCK4381721.1 hypothetical protein [Candidatus Lokiarchaeota archaeon]
MNSKFSREIQDDIEAILKQLQFWKDIFCFNTEFYYDGWAIFLREKNLYPRCIVIFKSFENDSYSIKSFEVHLQNFKTEKFKELYSVEKIKNLDALLIELKEIIYGKDLGNQVLRMYKDTFS